MGRKEVRVIILWAEGKYFTAGMDLKAFSGMFSAEKDDQNLGKLYFDAKRIQDNLEKMHKYPKPVIAAVHSLCIGLGVDLSLAADVRLCSEDAMFAVQETKVGIVADLGTLQRISRAVGSSFAREMAFTGEKINAERALRAGLVSKVYKTKDELLNGAREMAKTIANNSPLVVQGTKLVLNYSDEHTIQEGLDYVALWNSSFIFSEDLTRAVTSFMEKKPPTFRSML
eukprot:TRINITY_DN368_c0_g1_i1.p1 TRINITY_DN368_c0_g1~~TRINITY_DN368_c0_g1_i1.p1  ORF type:complete len:227 (+),score=49.48 TRINITY_DN368_c0_g1_i1:202-882(+)